MNGINDASFGPLFRICSRICSNSSSFLSWLNILLHRQDVSPTWRRELRRLKKSFPSLHFISRSCKSHVEPRRDSYFRWSGRPHCYQLGYTLHCTRALSICRGE
jgi:hypothetical protein